LQDKTSSPAKKTPHVPPQHAEVSYLAASTTPHGLHWKLISDVFRKKRNWKKHLDFWLIFF